MGRKTGNRFSQIICKFFNLFTLCSRRSTSYIIKTPSYSNTFIPSTPVVTRRNIYLSNRLQLTFYPNNFTSFDRTHQNKPIFSSSLSSLSYYPYSSTSRMPSAVLTNLEVVNNRADIIENSSSSPPPPPPPPPAITHPTASHFSYLIRPSTPCIFGRETYETEEKNDDEFFLTAGGIVHSCPNIYELSIDNNRKLQSCDHLICFDQQTTLIHNSHLNCYDTEFDRYSILPRFQPVSSSISSDSMNSELDLYKERHAIGLYRPCHDDTSISSSFLPTTWKSDNYLLFMPFIQEQHHSHSSFLNSLHHGKRSRSHEIPVEQTCAPVVA